MASDTTDRIYDRLPEHYRAADAALGEPLKGFLSLVGDQLDEVLVLADRIDELADPALADVAWLPWLAQALGVRIDGLTTAEAREVIAAGVGSPGSTDALRDAGKGALSGTKTVTFSRHYGTVWGIALATRHDETADVDDFVAAATRQKPAGVVLEHRWGVGTWADLHARAATWTAWHAMAATWSEFEDGT